VAISTGGGGTPDARLAGRGLRHPSDAEDSFASVTGSDAATGPQQKKMGGKDTREFTERVNK